MQQARSVLVVNAGGEGAVPEWQRHLPQMDVRWWHDPAVPPDAVHYALVWRPEPGRLATYPNLRAILSSGAGTDHITTDPTWPSHLPIIRLAEPEQAQRMAEYVCFAALALLHDMPRIVAGQAARRWQHFQRPRCAWDMRAGVMGLGNLGAAAAAKLAALGFPTAGWARSPRTIEGITCYAGEAEFAAFLARTDLLVCLLPDTPATRGIIRAETIALLPRGAGVINAARGSHVALPDLCAALESGQLFGAVLDVFPEEPLPPDHPIWTHPRIIVTPHMAALSSIPARARYYAAALAELEAGGRPAGLYDPARGY
jgi:glyoxylate/hydroxypyruvate reductase A